MQRGADGSVFFFFFYIPAMWLRDSSAQVRHYIRGAGEYPEIGDAVEGLLKRQFSCILIDPYANAFNKEANGNGHQNDKTEMSTWVWERKYEIDSLCYPIHLAYDFWRKTGRAGWHDETFRKAARTIVKLWKTEQNHDSSPYSFERTDCVPTDTLPFDGKGTPLGHTGMTWSGFRPSDDACKYGYLVPSNLFAAKALRELRVIVRELDRDDEFAREAETLSTEILDGVRNYAVVEHGTFGKIYAYETDGLGNYNMMDDANVPSLLSLPYLGCCSADDPVYQNTRRFILSDGNPFYFQGTAAKGIGSPHTPREYIWHIALCMQGLTSADRDEITEIADMIEATDAGTYLMHEGFNVDDPNEFTRPWFAWANSLFSEFVEYFCGVL
jgi:meiotically up-regulated gene 157 (Mug157) protein